MKKLALFLMTLALQTQAFALGNEIANGGDTVAAQFISNGQFLADNWSKLQLPTSFPLSNAQFAQLVKETIVETQEKVILEGREVDAINLPAKKRIIVSRTRWASISTYDRLVLSFHEYLGLATDVDHNFEVSPAALKGFSSEIDVLDRLAALLITSLELPAGQQCANLSGQYKQCTIDSEVLGSLNITSLIVNQPTQGGTSRLSIESNINGVTKSNLPGGQYDGRNTKVTCDDSIVQAEYHNVDGTVLSMAEYTKLGKDQLYIFLAFPGLLSAAITCK